MMIITLHLVFVATLVTSGSGHDNHKLVFESFTEDRAVRNRVLSDFRKQGQVGIEWLVRFAKKSDPDDGWHAVDVLADLKTPQSRRALCHVLDGNYDIALVARALRSGKELKGCEDSVARWIDKGGLPIASRASEALALLDLPRAIAATARKLQKTSPTSRGFYSAHGLALHLKKMQERQLTETVNGMLARSKTLTPEQVRQLRRLIQPQTGKMYNPPANDFEGSAPPPRP